MKITNRICRLIFIAVSFLTMIGCVDDFADKNTNPKALPTVEPESLLYTAETYVLTAGHCWNSNYVGKQRWMRYSCGQWGYNDYRSYSYFNYSIGNSVYNEYNNLGAYATNIIYLCDNHANAEAYSDLKQMARILIIAKGIQTSDIMGSLAYSNAWQARNGKDDEESLLPKFQTQKELSGIWDTELKECIANLKSSTNQKAIGGNDRAYNGDVSKWVKAANALRLRLATRLWKREPATAIQIATEVLSSSNAQDIFSSIDDSFIMWFDALYTNIHDGDWHSVTDLGSASVTIMDYLKENEDPRNRMFFIINNLTPENVAQYNELVKANYTEGTSDYIRRYIPDNFGRWEGGTTNPDNRIKDPAVLSRSFTPSGASSSIAMRPANYFQTRLWKGNHDNGSGGNWAPIMTYADFCFLAAEFVLREGISSSKTAQQWYDAGVRASLDQWNAIGKFCSVHNYEAITEDEIDIFLNKPNIKWSSNPAMQLEQIYAQSWVEHFKNMNESWTLWKRVNYPNTESTIVTFERVYYNGDEYQNPRRAKFNSPSEGVHNYENLLERLETMDAEPEFGGLNNEYGRLWWDEK